MSCYRIHITSGLNELDKSTLDTFIDWNHGLLVNVNCFTIDIVTYNVNGELCNLYNITSLMIAKYVKAITLYQTKYLKIMNCLILNPLKF